MVGVSVVSLGLMIGVYFIDRKKTEQELKLERRRKIITEFEEMPNDLR